ncbi:MAG: serine/threonine protein kinase [Candidatus Riflebacteria bacterium]|nr:serine/threonine protein kinase [Candidatus Riflebacteria bacterium]
MTRIGPGGYLSCSEVTAVGTGPFPDRCADRFLPVRPLGSGGSGTVWLATQKALGRPVVVKLLKPEILGDHEQIGRFLDEARITASLSHPNIVVLVDHDVEDGMPWIAYEYAEGADLRRALCGGPMEPLSAAEAVRQVAAALAEAHSRGVLHRDIKPENILQVGPDRYKVADFGIAKWMESSLTRTKAGMIVGTPGYMAPEVVLGESPGPAADVYSAGVVLFELSTGRLPYPTGSLVELLDHQRKRPVPAPSSLRPSVPEPLDRIVLRSVTASPADRYRSAAELLEELSTFLEPGGDAGPLQTGRARGRSTERCVRDSRRSPGHGRPAPAERTVMARPVRSRTVAWSLGVGVALVGVIVSSLPWHRRSVPATVVSPAGGSVAAATPHRPAVLPELRRSIARLASTMERDRIAYENRRKEPEGLDGLSATGYVVECSKLQNDFWSSFRGALKLYENGPPASRRELLQWNEAGPGLAGIIRIAAESIESAGEFNTPGLGVLETLRGWAEEQGGDPLFWASCGIWLEAGGESQHEADEIEGRILMGLALCLALEAPCADAIRDEVTLTLLGAGWPSWMTRDKDRPTPSVGEVTKSAADDSPHLGPKTRWRFFNLLCLHAAPLAPTFAASERVLSPAVALFLESARAHLSCRMPELSRREGVRLSPWFAALPPSHRPGLHADGMFDGPASPPVVAPPLSPLLQRIRAELASVDPAARAELEASLLALEPLAADRGALQQNRSGHQQLFLHARQMGRRLRDPIVEASTEWRILTGLLDWFESARPSFMEVPGYWSCRAALLGRLGRFAEAVEAELVEIEVRTHEMLLAPPATWWTSPDRPLGEGLHSFVLLLGYATGALIPEDAVERQLLDTVSRRPEGSRRGPVDQRRRALLAVQSAVVASRLADWLSRPSMKSLPEWGRLRALSLAHCVRVRLLAETHRLLAGAPGSGRRRRPPMWPPPLTALFEKALADARRFSDAYARLDGAEREVVAEHRGYLIDARAIVAKLLAQPRAGAGATGPGRRGSPDAGRAPALLATPGPAPAASASAPASPSSASR